MSSCFNNKVLPSRLFTRRVSDYIYFNVDAGPSAALGHELRNLSQLGKASGRLKVPLLKSPFYFGHFSSRVNRVYNEDKYSAAILDLPFNQYNHDLKQQLKLRFKQAPEVLGASLENLESLQVFNFNIFDGHGGDKISKYLSGHLSESIEKYDQGLLTADRLAEIASGYMEYFKSAGELQASGFYWKRWLRACSKTYERLYKENSTNLDDLSLRLLFSYLQLDYDMLTKSLIEGEQPPKGGSTSTSVFIYSLIADSSNKLYFEDRAISKVVISHIGDTKCIIVDKYGIAHALTSDHHPDSPVESTRLAKFSSNMFMNMDSFGEERFLNFANTRSFGDFHAKSKGITAEPEVFSSLIIGNSQYIKEQPNSAQLKDHTIGALGGDESFMVLVSDGVTNYCGEQEIADLIMSTYNLRGVGRATPQVCAEELIHYVEAVGGDDNATCLVIRLNGWGKWPMMDRTGKLREEKLHDGYTTRRT